MKKTRCKAFLLKLTWDANFVKPTMSANNILKYQFKSECGQGKNFEIADKDMEPLERADTLMRRTLLEARDIILRARYRFIYGCYINTDIIFERFFLKTPSFRIKRFRPLTSVIIRLS